METTNQSINQNSFFAPKLNLDGEFTTLDKDLRNALNLKIEGFNSDGYWVTNDLSNKLCYTFPVNYKLCGQIKLDKDEYVLFLTDDINSEIGILDTNTCQYRQWVNSPCLAFNVNSWISGVYKYNTTCKGRTIYTNDNINSDRNYNIDESYPRIITGFTNDSCSTPIYSNELDCQAVLATPNVKYPCISLSKTLGNLSNGNYQVAVAFSNDGFAFSEYVISQPLTLFSVNDLNGLNVELDYTDNLFTNSNVKVILLQQTKNGVSYWNLGEYDFNTKLININSTKNYTTVSLEEVLQSNVYYVKSKHIEVLDGMLLKADLQEREEINYQYKANNIKSNWVVSRVKAVDAYKYPQYMRDEVYAFYIRWVYKDGSYTKAFHIPNNTSAKNNSIVTNNDAYEASSNCDGQIDVKYWEIYNTATKTWQLTNLDSLTCSNDFCDKIIMRGEFGQYESTQLYSDDKFSYNGIDEDYTFGNLSCTPIKLHKFPDNTITNHFYVCPCSNKEFVDILGIEFEGIKIPLNSRGKLIPDIAGYEIMRADRLGNESIYSKGLISNMGIDDAIYEGVTGDYLYPNFPYNDLNPNKFLSSERTIDDLLGNSIVKPLQNFSDKHYTYLSPESSYTLFQRGSEIKLYNEQIGHLDWKFNEHYQHPKNVLLNNFGLFMASYIGLAIGTYNFLGGDCTTTTQKGEVLSVGNTSAGSLVIGGASNSLGLLPSVAGIGVVGAQLTAQSFFLTPSKVIIKNSVIGIPVPVLSPLDVEIIFNTNQTANLGVSTVTGSIQIAKGTFVGGTITVLAGNMKGNTLIPTSLTVSGLVNLPAGEYTGDSIIASTLVDGASSGKNGLLAAAWGSAPNSTYDVQITPDKTTTTCASVGGITTSLGRLPGGIDNFITSAYFGWQATKEVKKILYSLREPIQYAWQFDSVSNYNRFENTTIKGETRREILVGRELYAGKQNIHGVKINNENRVSSVYLELGNTLRRPLNKDISRFLSTKTQANSDINGCYEYEEHKYTCGSDINKQSVNYYCAIKNKKLSQYGNLQNLRLLPISCTNYISDAAKRLNNNSTFTTQPLYNGDTGIYRFTAKNHFKLFKDIPLENTDNFPIDYRKYHNVAYPCYWADTNEQSVLNLFQFDLTNLFSPTGDKQPFRGFYNLNCDNEIIDFSIFDDGLSLQDVIDVLRNLLDTLIDVKNWFYKTGKFYTSVNGVYNYFCETTYNNDWREEDEKSPHYPVVTYEAINRADKQIYDNKFLYDQSLRLPGIYKSSSVQITYDYSVCNVSDFKMIYSLKHQDESKIDYWKIFKPLNYVQFSKKDGALTNIHSNNHRLFISFEDRTYMTQRDDALVTKSGSEVFLGTGDLFSRRLLPLSEELTGITGCIDKYSWFSSRHGTYWLDRKRKKLFKFTDKLETISDLAASKWFQEFLNKQTPNNYRQNFKGIYDNHYDTHYFTDGKRDCNWTLSYKNGLGFQSFHSFLPISYFWNSNDYLTANETGIWKHNQRYDNDNNLTYQTYYDTQYPYSLTYTISEKQQPFLLQNIELKNEVTTELSYNTQQYHQDLFFNKIQVWTDRGSTGELDIVVKNPRNRLQNINNITTVNNCFISHVETNYWRINQLLNRAIEGYSGVSLGCNGNSYLPNSSINPLMNPRDAGNIRGTFANVCLTNDTLFDKRFKTFISLNKLYNIKR
jgi:hypothetical protein